MDLPGTALFLPAIVCILIALQWGGTIYAWRSWRIILLLTVGGILLVCFVVLQFFRGENATVPIRVYKNRNIWGASAFAFGIGGAFFILVYYVSCSLCR